MAEFDALQLPIFDIVVDSFLAHSQIIGCLLNPDQPREFRPLVFFALPDCDFQFKAPQATNGVASWIKVSRVFGCIISASFH